MCCASKIFKNSFFDPAFFSKPFSRDLLQFIDHNDNQSEYNSEKNSISHQFNLSKSMITLPVFISDLFINCLIDTGASSNFISLR